MTWTIDLSAAGAVRSLKVRPANRRRQKIARFLGSDGAVEHFSIQQTAPYCGYEADCPPSVSQKNAVYDFYQEPCETRYQARTFLDARDYAQVVAGQFRFSAARKRFIWVCAAAFILSERDVRALVRSWSVTKGSSDVSVGIGGHKAYKIVTKFAERLVDDMRGTGSAIFG